MSDSERPMSRESQGGMTGATGNLTPEQPDDEFVPAETREISDPAAARGRTAAAHRRAEARRVEAEKEEAARSPRPDPATLGPGPILGGDERHDPDDEHL